VSAIFAAPQVQNSLSEDGQPIGTNGELLQGQIKNVSKQLFWFAEAAKLQRERVGFL